MAIVRDYTALLSGSRWSGSGGPGTPVILTYSFETRPQSYLSDGGYSRAAIASFQALSDSEKALAREALKQWAAVSGVEFIEVKAGQGELRFGEINIEHTVNKGVGAVGYAYYPGRDTFGGTFSNDYALGGDVFTSSSHTTTKHTLLHEIGHALGLKHPFDGDTTLAADLDHHGNTVMSYTGNHDSIGLGRFDIDAVRHVHGADRPAPGTLTKWSWNEGTKVLVQTWGSASSTIGGTGQKDTINGGSGNDRISGYAGADKLDGGLGNDTLFGGDGADFLHGGKGNDTMSGGDAPWSNDRAADTAGYADARLAIFVDLTFGFWINNRQYHARGRDIGNDQLGDIENIDGGRGSDTIAGNERANVLNGNAGADALTGLGGADKLNGGVGNDTLDGGTHNDLLLGYFGQDNLIGGAGNDTLDGGRGNDTLRGGPGLDEFRFSSYFGRDSILDFGDNRDTIAFDDALWTGRKTVSQVIATHATLTDEGARFDFGGGKVLLVAGVENLTTLLNDIVIF